MNLENLISEEIKNGYGDANARAKVCQDIVLKALSKGTMINNVTIKGGVVMRSKTKNVRRATQDIDIDFIKYSLSDDAIKQFVKGLNTIEGINIKEVGHIEELKQKDYNGKRVFVQITDQYGNSLKSKIDLGVHNRFNIEQEQYCFDIAWDEVGASLLINSNEQMLVEKLISLLRLGPISTRYKDVYDIYYITKHVNKNVVRMLLEEYVFKNNDLMENNITDIFLRIQSTFNDFGYNIRFETSDRKWIDEDNDRIRDVILDFLRVL